MAIADNFLIYAIAAIKRNKSYIRNITLGKGAFNPLSTPSTLLPDPIPLMPLRL